MLDEKDLGIVWKILRRNKLVGLPGQKQISSTRVISFSKLWYNLENKYGTVCFLCFTNVPFRMNLTTWNYRRCVKKCNLKKKNVLLHQTTLSLDTKALSITILSPLGRFRETFGIFWRNGFKLNFLIAQFHHNKQLNRNQKID